jgi:O-antigen/teichoic acid export membrane protein
MALFKDYLITLAGRVAGALAAFLSLPLMLEYLGSSEYSVIAFASLVQGYANILDAGLSPALASSVAKQSGQRDKVLQIIRVSTNSFILKFGKYSLPLLVPLFATACVTLPYVSPKRLAILCVILLLDAFISAIFRLQYSALQGLGDHAIATSMHTLNIMIRTAFAVGLVVIGYEVERIYIAQTLITCAAILVSFRYYRTRQFLPHKNPSREIRSSEGSTTQDLTMIAIFLAVINSIPLIVLGRIGGSDELNNFFLATSLGSIVATLQGSLISVMIPGLSRELSLATLDNQHRDFRRMSRNVVFVSFALGGLAFCLAEPIVSIWIRKTGLDLTLLTTLFQFQLIAAAFVSLTIVPYVLSIPLHQTRIQFIGVGIYLLACCIVLPLARLFGTIEIFGLMAMMLGVFFSTGYFLASANLIQTDAQPFRVWIFIAGPVSYIAMALVTALVSGKMLASVYGQPAWLISSSIYVFLFLVFLFECNNNSRRM